MNRFAFLSGIRPLFGTISQKQRAYCRETKVIR